MVLGGGGAPVAACETGASCARWERGGARDRETERQRDRETERQRQRDRDRQRQTEREREGERERDGFTFSTDKAGLGCFLVGGRVWG